MVFIDTHFHASPDVMPRRLTISAAASEYKAENGLVWVKRHDGETISSSNVLFKQGIDVGGIAVLQPKDIEDLSHLEIILSQCKGNLRPIVSLPTKWVPEFVDMLSSTYFKNKIKCIFEMIIKYDAVLATGHIPSNIFLDVIFNDFLNLENIPLLVTHAFHPCVYCNDGLHREISNFFNAFFEHTELTYSLGRICLDRHLSILTNCRNLIYSSDFGQVGSPDVHTWRENSCNLFRLANLTRFRCEEISFRNAAKLLIRDYRN